MTVDDLMRKLAHMPGEAKVVLFTEAGREHYVEIASVTIQKPQGSFVDPVVALD